MQVFFPSFKQIGLLTIKENLSKCTFKSWWELKWMDVWICAIYEFAHNDILSVVIFVNIWNLILRCILSQFIRLLFMFQMSLPSNKVIKMLQLFVIFLSMIALLNGKYYLQLFYCHLYFFHAENCYLVKIRYNYTIM